jgi:ribosomal protein S5
VSVQPNREGVAVDLKPGDAVEFTPESDLYRGRGLRRAVVVSTHETVRALVLRQAAGRGVRRGRARRLVLRLAAKHGVSAAELGATWPVVRVLGGRWDGTEFSCHPEKLRAAPTAREVSGG